jgi:trimethylamine--corrinoid protein Co-methyltransferase
MDVNDETLALDIIGNVGPGGHYLSQRHTRKHMRLMAKKMGITHQMDAKGKYRDPLEVAREKVKWILENYQPEPLEEAKKAELTRILQAADRELS